jgi:UDP-N-acetyl-D-mannosaminuronic acid transferase (WecB/TagA/CpsF family)
MNAHQTRQILGIHFFIGTASEAVAQGLEGGLVVVPSAPSLLLLQQDVAQRDALLNADLAITDSGAMVLLWRMLTGEKIPRVSGLEYIKLLLKQPSLCKPRAIAWVMPTKSARDRNLKWLRSMGFSTTSEDCYVAPQYAKTGPIVDSALSDFILERRPQHIILALGGGTQERLGWFLKQKLDYRPGMHGIGAAIGFLNGDQVRIPNWANRWYLGWLLRCLYRPGKFIPRYWEARKFIPLMIRYRDRLPPLTNASQGASKVEVNSNRV